MQIKKVESGASKLIFVESDIRLLETFDSGKFSEALEKRTSSELCELLDGLISRLKETDAPNEEKGIEKLSMAITQELGKRIHSSESKKTERNRLIRYLRIEIEQLKNKLR